MRFFKTKEQASIDEPVFIIGYMRSGSNFIANVICQSCGKQYTSIYAPDITPILRTQPYYILKSHAPSYSHLLAECGAFVPCLGKLPHKMIVLLRDPRDVFISLHEWLEWRFNVTIGQLELLHNMQYGYSVPGLGHISPLDAYKMFISNWWEYNENTSAKNVIRIKYEELVVNKKKHFEKIFDFLGLEQPIRCDLFDTKVQQANSVREKRGVNNSWKVYGNKYAVLIQEVTSELGYVIERFGYEI